MLITAAVLLVWQGTAFAADLMVKVPVEEYQETKKQLSELKKQVDELEKKIDQPREPREQAEPKEPSKPTRPTAVDDEYSDSKIRKIDQDISFIYDTLDQVETAALLDRISFGAEVRVRMDNYRVENYVGAYVDFSATPPTFVPVAVDDERNDSNWSSRFRINMDAEVSESIKFAGRLALYKNWADSMGVFMSADHNRAHVSDGTTNLKVDRFYINWTPKFVTPVSISFGRLPTTDGPPLEFKEDRQRQSIYPALMFDGEPDGIVLTAGLERYIHLKNSGLRYFYAMATQYDADHVSMNHLDTVWMDSYKDNRVQALFFETELLGLRDSLLVLSYVPAENILVQSPFSAAGSAQAIDNIGDITLYGIHFQVPNLFGSGLDFFASYGENRNEPSGNTIDYAGLNFGLFSGGPDGLAADAAPTGTTTGWAWYTGLRYELPVDFLNRPKLGFEYNRGNKYWFSYTPGSADMFNRLATRGEAYDFYYIQPFNQNLFLRTGYTHITYEATGSGLPFGLPTEYVGDMALTEEPEFHNFYILLDSRF
jgi:hypothetical protein